MAGQFSPSVASYPTTQNVKNLVMAGQRRSIRWRAVFTSTPGRVQREPALVRGGHPGGDGRSTSGPRDVHFNIAAHAFFPSKFTWNGSAVVPAAGKRRPRAEHRRSWSSGAGGSRSLVAFENSDHLGALADYWGFVALPSLARGTLPTSRVTPLAASRRSITRRINRQRAAAQRRCGQPRAGTRRTMRSARPRSRTPTTRTRPPSARRSCHHPVQPQWQLAAVPVRRDPRAGAPPLAGFSLIQRTRAFATRNSR